MIDELINYVSQSYEFVTRKNAARALQRLGYFDITFMRHLVDGVVHWSRKLYGPCGVVLKHFYNQNKTRMLIDSYVKGIELTDQQRKRIKTYLVVQEFLVR